MANNKNQDLVINSIVGPGSSVHGSIKVAGFIRVDGAVKGDVSAKGRIVLGEKARMESDLRGTSVVVGGVVKGNIFASERVLILSTGLVLGDIITKRIQADEGVFINGRVIVCGEDGDFDARLKAYLEERGIVEAAGGKVPRIYEEVQVQ